MADQYQINLDRTANVPITEGIHQFSVAEIAEGESKAGNPMWTVKLACLDEAEAGKQVSLFLVLTDAARWKFEAFLDAVLAPKTGSATASQFVGRKLRAQITHEDYEGKPQARIGEMWPMTTRPATPAPAVKPVVTKTSSAPTATAKVPAKASTPAAKRNLPKDVAGDDPIPF